MQRINPKDIHLHFRRRESLKLHWGSCVLDTRVEATRPAEVFRSDPESFSNSRNSVPLKRLGPYSRSLSSLSKHRKSELWSRVICGRGGGVSWEGCDTWRQQNAADVGRLQLPGLSRSASRYSAKERNWTVFLCNDPMGELYFSHEHWIFCSTSQFITYFLSQSNFCYLVM